MSMGGTGSTHRAQRDKRYRDDKELLLSTDLYQSGEWFSVEDIVPEWGMQQSAVRFAMNQFAYYGVLDKKTEGGHNVELFQKRDMALLNRLWRVNTQADSGVAV